MSTVRPPALTTREGPAPSAQDDALVGRLFGQRYRVVRRLGEGGMGTVFLCEHVVLGRRFAVKVLRADRQIDAELAERFRTEAVAASGIGQENVVDVVDYGEEPDGTVYYVMEALDGRSLGALLREEGPLAVGRALALLEQICRALAAAHARGVIHRDVKPENVFVVRAPDGADRAKVIDFGISRIAPVDGTGERLTRDGAIIGTPEYMAPEQASGAGIDVRADVYAVGVLAYEMLTGGLPIVGATPIATLVAHQTRIPEAPGTRQPGIPPEVDALVLRALAKRPEDRFESMLVFAAEIGRIRGEAALPADPAHPAAPAAPTARYEAPARSSGRRNVATVALPESTPGRRSSPPVARRTAVSPGRRTGALVVVTAAAVGAAVLVLALALGLRGGPDGGSVPSMAASTPTPTSTSTGTSTGTGSPTPTESPLTPTLSPAVAGERELKGVTPTTVPPARRVARPRPAPRQEDATPADHHEVVDPYAGGGDAELKDPFR